MERVKPIIITMEDGTEYTLEFNRDAVARAERASFNIDDVDAYPMTKVPELFFFAFRMHHPRMTKQQTDSILFDGLKGLSEEAIKRLVELYYQGMTALVNNGGDDEKKSTATVIL